MNAALVFRKLQSLGRQASGTAADLVIMARLARDLPAYLRAPITADQARSRVRERLATREKRLVTVFEHLIYGNAKSPYLMLLRQAGCELGDVRTLVSQNGVEGALSALAARGVYLTFEEIKGRREVVRGSQRFSFTPEDFDNPVVRPHLVVYTGGSGGRPGRVRYPLALIDEWAESVAVTLAAHGVHQPRVAFWWPVAFSPMTLTGRLGYSAVGWFYPVHPLPLRAHLAARYYAMLSRLAGRVVPLPRRCDLDTPEQMVEWLAEQRQAGHPVLVWTMASLGVRIGVAAKQAGQDLSGVTLYVGSEAITEARRQHILASGAQVVARYSTTELRAGHRLRSAPRR